jgi:hypothetical protein
MGPHYAPQSNRGGHIQFAGEIVNRGCVPKIGGENLLLACFRNLRKNDRIEFLYIPPGYSCGRLLGSLA